MFKIKNSKQPVLVSSDNYFLKDLQAGIDNSPLIHVTDFTK